MDVSSPFALIPAVSLRRGEVVVVQGAAYEPIEDEAGEPFAIDEFAEVFLKGYKAMLVFDIDGIEGEGAQFDEVARVEGGEAEVWWDAGVRTEEDVINILTSGVDRAIVGTRALKSAAQLRACVEVTENLVFEVTARGSTVQSAARDFAGLSVPEAARVALREGVQDLLLLDTGRALGAPIDWQTVRAASPGWSKVFVGGGLEAATAPSLAPPPGVPLAGAVVDLVSVLAPYL
jgi:phosphoribosylformimino-5-aminoimidazole carboxamide ribonucleotide (ProFAR) isomerase